MELNRFDSFITAVQGHLEYKQPFRIKFEEDLLTWVPVEKHLPDDDMKSLTEFGDFVSRAVRMYDLKRISEEQHRKIIQLTDLYEIVVDHFSKLHDGITKTIQYNRLRIRAIRLGGAVPVEVLKDQQTEMIHFIEVNGLEKKFQFYGIQVQYNEDMGISIPMETDARRFRDYCWEDLTIKTLKNSSDRVYGYRFFYGDRVVFQTDKALRLEPRFIVMDRGLLEYHPTLSGDLFPMRRKDPKHWNMRNLVQLWAWKELNSGYSLVIKRRTGEIYSIGIKDKRICSPHPQIVEHLSELKPKIISVEVCDADVQNLLNGISDKKCFRKRDVTETFLLESLKKVGININCQNKKSISFLKKCKSWKKESQGLKEINIQDLMQEMERENADTYQKHVKLWDVK